MRRKPTESLQAYDLMLRADALIRSGSRIEARRLKATTRAR